MTSVKVIAIDQEDFDPIIHEYPKAKDIIDAGDMVSFDEFGYVEPATLGWGKQNGLALQAARPEQPVKVAASGLVSAVSQVVGIWVIEKA